MAPPSSLPFEQSLSELSARLRELRTLATEDPSYVGEVGELEREVSTLARELFQDLTPWQKVMLCRHPRRPYMMDYVERLFEDFVELHGDRTFGEDAAIVGGLARYPRNSPDGGKGRGVVVIGHQKGRGTKEAMRRNFGMPNPEGYRKARRLMELADRFGRPIVTFLDTNGAYPGLGAEERGQAEAIAQCLLTLSRVRVPVVACVIGEGGSGGALALGLGNRVLALEHIWYSVISPEACASILWKDGAQAEKAAAVLKPTAQMGQRLGVIDTIIEEPPGGAHQDVDDAAGRLDRVLRPTLESLLQLSESELIEDRYRRFRNLGAVGT